MIKKYALKQEKNFSLTNKLINKYKAENYINQYKISIKFKAISALSKYFN